MKNRIINMLRTHDGVLSGTAISESLGVSRVSVWKHISALQACGYPIASSPRGYRMDGDVDVLFPWEFGPREPLVHYHPEAASTMDLARDLAHNGCPANTVVIAGRQSRGRGRLDRQWVSGEGGLFFTVVLRPETPPPLAFRCSFAASLAMADAVEALYDVAVRVKWPNDLLFEDRKIAGMLAEMETRADMVRFINIGLGVNVNNDPPVDVPHAVSLHQILGRRVVRRDLLSRFLDILEERLSDDAMGRVVDDWKQRSATLNRDVRVVTRRTTLEGRAVDIDENGALVLRLPDGSRQQVVYGDCFLK